MELVELTDIVAKLRLLGSDVSDVEAKKAEGGLPRSLRDSLSAFSNTRGGLIILGLDEGDSFRATGIIDAAKMASDLASMCASDMHPPLRPLITTVHFEDVNLVIAEVPELEDSQKPCYNRGRGVNTGSFIRVHDGDHQMTTYEVQSVIANRGQPREDVTPVAGHGIEVLDSDLLESFVDRLRTVRPSAFGELTTEQVLLRTKVLTTGLDGRLEVTLGGLLALGSYPQEHFPQLSATFVVYPTNDGPDVETGTRFLDSATFEGPIPIIARDALGAIRRNMKRRSVVKGVGRVDTWEYPESALREAIVNALVHRDLSPASRGTQVQIEMYPSRILIKNPGGLFGPVSVDALADLGISSSRNSFLLKALEDVALPGQAETVCENRGSGIRTMVEALRAAGMSVPRFEDKISSFSVTFPNHALLDDETVEWIRNLGEDGLSDSQHIGLATLYRGGVIDNTTYRNATGCDSRVATNELQDLVSRELIIQLGTRRWTEYRLAARARSVSNVGGPKLPPRDRRGLILEAISTEQLSRAQITELTGLNKQVVIHWLRILRRENLIQIVGQESPQSRNVRYERTPNSWGMQPLDFGDLS